MPKPRMSRLPPHSHGKEGVDGSSPSEGLRYLHIEAVARQQAAVKVLERVLGRPGEGLALETEHEEESLEELLAQQDAHPGFQAVAAAAPTYAPVDSRLRGC